MLLFPPREGCRVLQWALLCIYVSTHIYQKSRYPNVTKFCVLCVLPVAMTQSSYSGIAICYILLVLWMTSYFHIMGHMACGVICIDFGFMSSILARGYPNTWLCHHIHWQQIVHQEKSLRLRLPCYASAIDGAWGIMFLVVCPSVSVDF